MSNIYINSIINYITNNYILRMFQFKYYNTNNSLTNINESEIYDFFCKLVLNAELQSIQNCEYDHNSFKIIAKIFRIESITNKINNNIKRYQFYFDNDGNLIKLERYSYNGILELTKNFDINHQLIKDNNNNNEDINYYVDNAFGGKLQSELKSNIIEQVYSHIHNLNKSDIRNNSYDIGLIKNLFDEHNIEHISMRINGNRHGYTIIYDRELNILEIIRFHFDYRIFYKSFNIDKYGFSLEEEIYHDDLVHHHHKYMLNNGQMVIDTSDLIIPQGIKRKLDIEFNANKKLNNDQDILQAWKLALGNQVSIIQNYEKNN